MNQTRTLIGALALALGLFLGTGIAGAEEVHHDDHAEHDGHDEHVEDEPESSHASHDGSLLEQYLDLATDPAHILMEVSGELVVNGLVGLMLWPLAKRAVRRHDAKAHGIEDVG